MVELQQDDYLRIAYIENYPGDDEFDEIPWNPAEELSNAKPVKEALESFGISDKDLYYSFLKDEVRESEPDDFAGWAMLDRKIILRLWESGIEYTRIPRVLMYSPIHQMPEAISLSNTHTLRERWETCATRVTAIINPVLDQPMIIGAKLPCQLDLLKSSKQDIYISYLKNVLCDKPWMTLEEADKKVVAKLLQTKLLPESTVFECIGNSLQFTRRSEDTDDKEGLLDSIRVSKKRQKFWEETLNELATSESEKDTAYPRQDVTAETYDEPKDLELWDEMLEKVGKFRESLDTGKTIEYWRSIIDILKETVVQMEQLKYQAQLLLLWEELLGKMADDLKLAHPEDEKEIQECLLEIVGSNDSRSETLERLCDILVRLDELTESFLTKIFEKRDNPLLAVSKLQNAKPLSEVLSQKKPNAADVYFAFLKDVAESGVTDIDTADEAIICRLNGMFDASLSESDRKREIAKCIAYSPAFSKLDGNERRQSAGDIVNNVLGNEQHDEKKKISSR